MTEQSVYSSNMIKKSSTDELRKMLSHYKVHQRPLSVNFRKLASSIGGVDRATHLIHTYPAKLLMHIPYFFLGSNSLTASNDDVIVDPFCGSGTVLLEASLAGKKSLGIDANPLATLISKVKTNFIENSHLVKELSKFELRMKDKKNTFQPNVVNLEHWFYPHVIKQLNHISSATFDTDDVAVRNFLMICLSQCVRKVSLADPRLAVPVRLRPGQYPRNHPLREKTDAWLRKLARINVFEVFDSILSQNIHRISKLKRTSPRSEVLCADTRSKNIYPDLLEKVDLIITSPPYPGAQKYIRSSELSLNWLKLADPCELRQLKSLSVGREEFRKSEWSNIPVSTIPSAKRNIDRIARKSPIRATIAATYLEEMKDSLDNMYQLLKPGGHLVLVAANNNICGAIFRTQEYLRIHAEEVGFKTILRLKDIINSRGLMTKRNKTASVITCEWVLVFKKKA